MVSDIVLFEGKSSLKENEQDGCFVATPKAFLTEDFAGVRIEEKNQKFIFYSENTGRKSLLAAIRGALLAQELRFVSESDPYKYFFACSNDEKYEDFIDYEYINEHLGISRFNQIRTFIPEKFEDILQTLVKIKFPFDGNEVANEINAGRIKKSSTIEDLLYKNREITTKIDEYEYGLDIDLNKLKTMLNTDFYVFAHIFRPFTDEYFENFDQNQFRAVQYGSVNSAGIYLFSKLKSHANLNFNLSISIANEMEGQINNLKENPGIYSFLLFKKSNKSINTMRYTKKILENLYGTQENYTLQQKLPFLYKQSEAMIFILNKKAVAAIPEKYEFADKINSMKENIQKKRDFVEHYILPCNN